MVHNGLELFAAHRFMLQQVIGYLAQLFHMSLEDVLALTVAAAENILHLLVDPGGGFLGIALGLTVIPANEYLAVGIEGHRAQLGAHAGIW